MISMLLLSFASTVAPPPQAPAELIGGLRRGAFFEASVAPLPGRGTFLALEGADHGFLKAAFPRESLARGGTPGEFNPAVLEACHAWVEKVRARG